MEHPGCPAPSFYGQPVTVTFRAHLSAYRGLLLQGSAQEKRGVPVHAGSFLPSRSIVLDSQLLLNPSRLRRIFLHEAFHFVWPRLGNTRRSEWESILRAELEVGTAGELGHSSESRKLELDEKERMRRGRPWREYVCESFCDSAAWAFGPRRHVEVTLPAPARRRRLDWFRCHIAGRPLAI